MSTKKTTAKKVKKPAAKKLTAKKTVKKEICGLKKKKLEPLKVRKLRAENKRLFDVANHNFKKAEESATELRKAERRYNVLKNNVDTYVRAARALVEASSNQTPGHYDKIWKKAFDEARKKDENLDHGTDVFGSDNTWPKTMRKFFGEGC